MMRFEELTVIVPTLTVVLIGACLLAPAVPRASAQSIDCGHASNAVQKAICGDPDLKSRDATMVSLYADATKRATAERQRSIAAEQGRWVVIRDACASKPDLKSCVKDAYARRSAVLSAYTASAMDRAITFTCEDKSTLTVKFLPPPEDRAEVAHGSSTWTLPHVKSGSGARYAGNGVSVWNKGNDILFEQGTAISQLHGGDVNGIGRIA
jgi:uncharacterized protein